MNQLFDASLDAKQKNRFYQAVMAVIILLALFLGVKAINTIKEYSYIGSGVYPTNTITVNGTGEVFAVPDIASFSFSVNEEGKTVKEAQDKTNKKMDAILSALEDLDIDEKDIKTENYNSGPKYEWRQGVCPLSSDANMPVYCPQGKNVLIGYEVSQTISVKVRNIDDAGTALTKIGELGATNISSLDFVVDDKEAVKAEARDLAIANAKAKAKTLSKSLQIKLVKIISFSDSGDYPQPYYGMGGEMDAKSVSIQSAPTPAQIPVGENKIVSNVTITYEVR